MKLGLLCDSRTLSSLPCGIAAQSLWDFFITENHSVDLCFPQIMSF